MRGLSPPALELNARLPTLTWSAAHDSRKRPVGTLEGTLLSVETDPLGRYRSPKLIPGTYTVEAMLPGYVIERSVVVVRSHEYKRVDLALYRIGEADGKSLSEADEDNIHAPGEVQIGRPKF